MALTFACWGYDRTEALRSGEVKVEGFDIDYLDLYPREIFDRMGGTQEFAGSEFSFTEYTMHYARGNSRYVAIPVFPSRAFRHSFIFLNRHAGIETPKDLEGKRVGLPIYTMTAALWQRGMLHDEYGVDWHKIDWIQGQVDGAGAHGAPVIPELLKPVKLGTAPSDKSLGDMLVDRTLDASMGTRNPDTAGHPDLARLFPDHRAAERAYFTRTGLFPIMHLVAIRRDVHEAHPGFAQALYTALCKSKAAALKKMHFAGANISMSPFLAADVEEIDEVFGGDPFSYGIERNRATIETMIRYMVEQDYIPETIPVEDLFLPVDDL
jgi:4,5-dihydroxyphthalate decarboxylase